MGSVKSDTSGSSSPTPPRSSFPPSQDSSRKSSSTELSRSTSPIHRTGSGLGSRANTPVLFGYPYHQPSQNAMFSESSGHPWLVYVLCCGRRPAQFANVVEMISLNCLSFLYLKRRGHVRPSAPPGLFSASESLSFHILLCMGSVWGSRVAFVLHSAYSQKSRPPQHEQRRRSRRTSGLPPTVPSQVNLLRL